MGDQYSIPDYIRVSADYGHLLSRIFAADPAKRNTIPEIKQHPWLLKSLPKDLVEIDKEKYEGARSDQPTQKVEEILRIIQEAKMPVEGSKAGGQATGEASEPDDVDADVESEVDVSGDYVTAL